MRISLLLLVLAHLLPLPMSAQAVFESGAVLRNEVGLGINNVGIIGSPEARLNSTSLPSFAYPLGSGTEHLFEAGLWIGGIPASGGGPRVRTAAVTSASGYSSGQAGYDMAPITMMVPRSVDPDSPHFHPDAVSELDVTAAYADTFAVFPGTEIPLNDPADALGSS